MRSVLKGLLGWLVLSVPVALLVSQVLKERPETKAQRASREQWERRGHPVYGGPRAIPDRPEWRGHQDRWEQMVHPVPPDRRARWEMWE